MIDSHATAARWSVNQTILIAGLAAAILEILPALIVQGAQGVSPLLLFQSISSGLLGQTAYSDGIASALFGAAIHLFISLVAAGIFVFASRVWPILIARYVFAGLFYGAIVYAVMNYVVVPLSAIAFKPAAALPLAATSFAVHLVFFGLPISLVTRLAAARRRFS